MMEWWSGGVVELYGLLAKRQKFGVRAGIQTGKFRFGEDAETNRRDACATQKECVRSAQLEHRHVSLCAQRGFSPLQRLVIVRLCRTPLMRSALSCRLFRSQRVSNPLEHR